MLRTHADASSYLLTAPDRPPFWLELYGKLKTNAGMPIIRANLFNDADQVAEGSAGRNHVHLTSDHRVHPTRIGRHKPEIILLTTFRQTCN